MAIDGRLTIADAMPASSPFSSSICPGRWRAGAPRTAAGRVFRIFGHGQRALLGADVSSVLMKREALGPHSAAAPGRRLKRLSDRHRALCPALLSKIHSDRLQILLSWNFSAPKMGPIGGHHPPVKGCVCGSAVVSVRLRSAQRFCVPAGAKSARAAPRKPPPDKRVLVQPASRSTRGRLRFTSAACCRCPRCPPS